MSVDSGWTKIALPNGIIDRHNFALAPLNETEIVMFGGLDHAWQGQITEGSIVIFNTVSREFYKVNSPSPTLMMTAYGNRCVNVGKDTVVAIVDGQLSGTKFLVQYKKGQN